jgi:hypothetical protein
MGLGVDSVYNTRFYAIGYLSMRPKIMYPNTPSCHPKKYDRPKWSKRVITKVVVHHLAIIKFRKWGAFNKPYSNLMTYQIA